MIKNLDNANYHEAIRKTEAGILLCYKKLRPHCRNMEKVLIKFADKQSNIKLFSIDSEENTAVMEKLRTERIPTIHVIKNGVIKAKKSGLMNPREMADFYQSA